MKIHEQEWKVRNTSIGPIIDDTSGRPDVEAVCMVYAPMFYDGRQLTMEQSDAIRDERARFIESAPKMARALLEIRAALNNNTLDPDGAHEVCERALRSAGVL